jgi:outer membrane protein assembly factor BamB
MIRVIQLLALLVVMHLAGEGKVGGGLQGEPEWSQWRGPQRDGQVKGQPWPDRLTENYLEQRWRVPLGPSYSGPVMSAEAVFVTETRDKTVEVVRALSRSTGKELWKVEWPGAISVPFFAKPNGDWIRATPAFDGKSLYVAGMRDVLVSLDGKTGQENWRVDFAKEFNTGASEFGLVCSPLVNGNALYLQAANSVVKLDKRNGKVLWRALASQDNIMVSGAFSSPVLADVARQRQLVAQTREQLAGLDPANGKVLWIQNVPSFRGMNILTPLIVGDAIFTSSYQNKAWLYRIGKTDGLFSVTQAWENNAQGYMSSPVVINGYAYLHLGNQRFTCINLQTGERTWTSKPFGKYASLVAQRDRILALDERGILLLIKANPQEFELLSEKQISQEETWAHLAVSGEELYVRELNALTALRWRTPKGHLADNE